MKYGISSLNKQTQNNIINTLDKLEIFKAVRVLSIILDKSHPKFKEYGEWNSLGYIEYEDILNPLKTISPPIAKPINPNLKNYPLINEIVWILSLPDTSIGEFTSGNFTYYLNPISLWNHPHHNGFPSNPNKLTNEQNKDYSQTEIGDVRKITDQSSEIFLGKTFKEKSNIHPILPFEGDIINEGRWGNSIRLGSTTKGKNNWSSTGQDGDPIIILRNGQGKQKEEGWIPIVEDINNDNSSIYLTNNQVIPLKSISKYDSYKQNAPESLDKYSKSQIIINSERVVLNSTKDHILLSSNKTINLNGNEGINFDTPKNFIVQSNKIYLGNKSASEPLLLGNKTVELLNDLFVNLKSFMNICSNLISSPAGTPIPTLNLVATQMTGILEELTLNLKNITSKNNFTN